MVRPFLSLWPIWLEALVLPIPLVVCTWSSGPSVSIFSLAGISILLFGWHARPYWRLCKQIRQFHTIASCRVVLHYSPRLDDQLDFSVLLQRCEKELDELTQRFGFRLRRRVVVFLFASYRDVGKVFGPAYAGIALSPLNAVVIANDMNLKRMVRHELAHLFSNRWNLHAPPLLQEGLSVWLEGSRASQPTDIATWLSLADQDLRVPQLLNRKFFFSKAHVYACYALAGRFTGFLIRRYGWERYRRFYRRCYGPRFRAQFTRCFGVSLEKAEWQWRNELLVMEVLNRRRKSCLDF